MEQHPVPQNVTTFQFRLIGDMTLKQFGYLCAGAILAFISYRLPLPFLFTWPLAFAFAFLGVGFAFIPVEERPMDVWVFSFFKSIYNPTQYIWIKEAPKPVPAAQPMTQAPNKQPPPAMPPTAALQHTAKPTSSKTVLSGLFQQSSPSISPARSPVPQVPPATVVTTHVPRTMFSWITDLWNPRQPPAPHYSPIGSSSFHASAVTGHKLPPLAAPAGVIPAPPVADALAAQQKMLDLEASFKELQSQLATKNVTGDRVLELQTQLTDVLKHKTTMEDELIALKRQIISRDSADEKSRSGGQPASSDTASHAGGAPATTKSTVTVISTQDAAVKVGLPRLTNVANVITGMVKDNTGNLLPGILVTVTTHDEIPMRALKTNKLGQFAASTPLSSGTYLVEIEDPRGRFTFSKIQITLTGVVVPALEIIAKSEKQMTREKLSQEIFGTNTI